MTTRASLLAGLLLLHAAPAGAAEYRYVEREGAWRSRCAEAPPGWREGESSDEGWTDYRAPPDGGTACGGAIYARHRFDVGPELSRLRTLTLRLRYQHGFAAYLNGVEIARRRLDPGASSAALASELHGLEPESLFVPLRPGLLRREGNLLAIEVHPKTAGKEVLFEADLSGADGPRLVRGPYLVRVSEREATVVFDTDVPTLGEIRWSAPGQPEKLATDAPPRTHHAFRLNPLEAGQVYRYRVSARAPGETGARLASAAPTVEPEAVVDSGEAQLHTPPARGEVLRFAVYGDVRSGHDVHALINQRLIDEAPDLALVTGDLVDAGSDEGDWERFFEIARGLLRGLAIYPAPGNHEAARLGRGMARFLELFRWPLRPGEPDGAYYSFDAAGVHFVALDSNQYRSPAQKQWLERDLAAARKAGARAIFAFTHDGPWSSGMHGGNATCASQYVPILERYGTTMLFGGHDHHYERGKVGNLPYLVSGGGGAGLRLARCGVPGKRPCAPTVTTFANEHHYVIVEVLPTLFRVCPRRPDGTPIEPCTDYPLPK